MIAGEYLTVYKLDHNGHEVWQYPARVLERGLNHVRLEAFFNRDNMDLGYTVFKRGDRFIETFYEDRWYNVFAVYDLEGGGLKGWYCNICRPAEITTTTVRCDDLALDVWITPDGQSVVLDEDEFATLIISEHDRACARDALLSLLESGKSGRLPA
jgi:protein associated with RNAse G/E